MKRHHQSGITLVVSLIMLIVLTLLVVTAIRFATISLKIATNAQAEVEGVAATQVAIERVVQEVAAATKVDTVPAYPQMQVSSGGKTYKVDVAKPACILSKNVMMSTLDPSKDTDRNCFGAANVDPVFDANGKPIPQPSECKDQQWDVTATMADQSSGAQITILQGVAVRVESKVHCL